jgi:hypothetical protein
MPMPMPVVGIFSFLVAQQLQMLCGVIASSFVTSFKASAVPAINQYRVTITNVFLLHLPLYLRFCFALYAIEG